VGAGDLLPKDGGAAFTTDEGITGLDEVGLGYGTGTPAVAPMIRALGERLVLGKDPHNTETIWEQMLRRSFWAQSGTL
jgi:galactonate dehydratase